MKWYDGKMLEKEINWSVHEVENSCTRRVISDKVIVRGELGNSKKLIKITNLITTNCRELPQLLV